MGEWCENMSGIDFSELLALIRRADVLISIVFIVAAAWFGLRLVNLTRSTVHARLESDYAVTEDLERLARLNTLLDIGARLIRFLVVGLALFSLLSRLGVDIAPILAGLGVIGVSISLGAQTLVKDYISGLILLVENQYSVGERVTIGDKTGTVERIIMRVTWLRADNGELYSIAHGEVRVATNHSRDWGLVQFEMPVCRGVSRTDAQDLADKAIAAAVQDNRLADDIVVAPRYAWWDSAAESCSKLSITARATVAHRQPVEKLLHQAVRDAFAEHKILSD